MFTLGLQVYTDHMMSLDQDRPSKISRMEDTLTLLKTHKCS